MRSRSMRRFVVLACSVLAAPAVAAPGDPLVSKRNESGFTTPQGHRDETCTVYSDHVIITRRFGAGPGSFELRERRSVIISPGVQGAIRRALAEPVEETPNGICDVPSTAIFIGALDSDSVLLRHPGCAGVREERVGPYSDALRDLVDGYCPATNDFGSTPPPDNGGE